MNLSVHPVDAVTFRLQQGGASLDVCVADVGLRVQRDVIEFQSIHVGTAFEQRQELHVQQHALCAQQRVAVFDSSNTVERKVKRESEPHAFETDVHFHFFRKRCRDLFHRPVLNGRYIYNECKQEKQNDG